MMTRQIPLARRNLFHNKRRLVAALAGVSFSVVLVHMQVGVLLGMLANASVFIDRFPNEIWVMPVGTKNFDQVQSLPGSALYRARGLPGVAWAEKMIVGWGEIKTGYGTIEPSQTIGLPLEKHFELPFPVEPPSAAGFIEGHGVLVDEAERERLGIRGVGDELEISHVRVRILGFTSGMRSFTTSPYVLMRYQDAEEIQSLGDRFHYILVKATPGADLADLRRRLQERLPETAVLSSGEFRLQTYAYWLFGTGVGTAFLMAAVLGFLVGGAVVAQVLYATVVEQRPQFGVLKAIGASNAYLRRIVLGQALMTALVGYGTGMALTLPLVYGVRAVGTPIQVPWELAVGTFGAVVFVCLGAAILPMSQVTRLEPALVFRG